MKTKIKFQLIFLLGILLVIAVRCKKDDIPVDEQKEQASAITLKVNTFIKNVMTDVYLWYDQMPSIDIKYELDSKEYFYKLLYTDDKWSFITDDIAAFENSLQGVETTYGYSLAFGMFTSSSGAPTGTYFAVVEYVYPGTPAAKTGFTRGDIIVKINGEDITESNYINLFTSSSVSLTKGILVSGGISQGATVALVAEKLNLDPVLTYKIIERGGHKIGYLMYLQYIASYNSTSLLTALQYFAANNITDLVIDLRYNPGGYTSAAQYLCSSIAPANIVTDMRRLVTFQWNDKYQNYWTANQRYDQLSVQFDATVPVKLGLSKVYFLTGYGTASASELTICGLEPYMDVKIIGDTTAGKYTASITLTPADVYSRESDYADFKDWGLQPIVIRYANSEGLTNFKDGFAPDFYVRDELLPACPLGDITEPLLKKAVEDITGEIITSGKKSAPPAGFDIAFRRSSKFDNQKRNLFIDTPPELKGNLK